MPQKVLNQIKWLCKEIPKVEWSGILFYSIEGSIKDPENMVLTLEEILPMHKGSATYTEYAFDERVINFMMDTPGADDWKMGHIHSHNTMNVYFSGTDWSELEDNSPNHNFYLSLIVNNFMEFCAKVAFIVESDQAQFTAKDENGVKYNYSTEALEQKKMVTIDCDIQSPVDTITVSEGFSNKVEGIIESAAKRAVAKSKTVTYKTGTNTSRIVSSKTTTPTAGNTKGYKRGSRLGKPGPGWSNDAWDEPFFSSDKGLIEEEEEEEDLEEMYEQFAMFVLNTGNDTSSFTDMEDILNYYKAYQLSPNALASSIIKKYLNLYNNYFANMTDKDTPDTFTSITDGLIGALDTEMYTTNSLYVRDMLKPVVTGLQSLIDKFNSIEDEPNTIK